jgi:hypothetical protein
MASLNENTHGNALGHVVLHKNDVGNKMGNLWYIK